MKNNPWSPSPLPFGARRSGVNGASLADRGTSCPALNRSIKWAIPRLIKLPWQPPHLLHHSLCSRVGTMGLSLTIPKPLLPISPQINHKLLYLVSNTLPSMPIWRDEYLANIKDAELQIPVNMELVQACMLPHLPLQPEQVTILTIRQAHRWPIASLL